MAESKDKSVFDTLYPVDVSEHKEDKPTGNGKTLSYLSWAWAWAEVKRRFPDATYEIIKFDGIPYVFDPKTGYMVYTTVTINGVTHEMWLPVMDSNNLSMKDVEYQVQTKYKTITVKAATMFDINKTIMRCLTKNLAMFGLGLYIYAGEDLPEDAGEEPKAEEQKPKGKKTAEKKQPIQELPANACTICHKEVSDYTYTDPKTGDSRLYKADMIIKRSVEKFGSPICYECMAKKAAADKKKGENA